MTVSNTVALSLNSGLDTSWLLSIVFFIKSVLGKNSKKPKEQKCVKFIACPTQMSNLGMCQK